jgi:RNA polymerase sigma-70 factor, ECF subfamily
LTRMEHLIFRERLLRYAQRALNDRASAQDAVQATLEALLVAKSPFRGECSQMTYATAVLQHKIADILRDRQRYVASKADDPTSSEETLSLCDQAYIAEQTALTDPERQVYARELKNLLHHALQTLSPQHRSVVVMRESEGLTHEHIARLLSISVSSSFVSLHRAKQALRNAIGNR